MRRVVTPSVPPPESVRPLASIPELPRQPGRGFVFAVTAPDRLVFAAPALVDQRRAGRVAELSPAELRVNDGSALVGTVTRDAGIRLRQHELWRRRPASECGLLRQVDGDQGRVTASGGR